jgi:hypothetical protein
MKILNLNIQIELRNKKVFFFKFPGDINFVYAQADEDVVVPGATIAGNNSLPPFFKYMVYLLKCRRRKCLKINVRGVCLLLFVFKLINSC